MEALSDAVGLPLQWVQPRTRERQFELRAGDKLLGTLHFETAFGTLATAETVTGCWTFKRVGFLNPRVTIRAAGAGADLAVYWPKFWGDGWLEIAADRRFRWKSRNFWGTEWGFTDKREMLLCVLKPGVEKLKLSNLFKTEGAVEIQSAGSGLAELPLLLMLSWYLMILHQDDSAATAAATTAAVG